MAKLIRVTTVPMALHVLLKGQLRYMKENGLDVLMVSADGPELASVLQSEQCPHHIIPMTRKITPVADLKSLWQMYKLFRKEKPDIVHSHTPKAGLIAMLAAKMAGVPFRIHTIAGLRFMTAGGMTRRILVMMEKITARAATHVWPNSQSLLRYIKENKLVSEKKLEVIGKGSSNGIDLNRFSRNRLDPDKIEKAKAVISYDPSKTYLLSVGRIVKDKGISEIVNVFAGLYEKNNNLRLVLVGGFEAGLDPLDEEVMKTLNSHPGIILAGWHDEVEYFMYLSDIMVHASYREGFPNVILQAGALECPVICSRIPGNVDIVDEGENGLVFTVKDEADLKQKTTFALAQPEQAREMAKRLRMKIEQNFDTIQVRKYLLQKYLSLLKAYHGHGKK